MLGSPLVIAGDVLIDLWAALDPPHLAESGVAIAYLRDYDGASYTEITNGAVYARDWQSGSTTFVERMALIRDVSYTVPAGNELELRLLVADASQHNMWLAYDMNATNSLKNLFL